MKCPKCGIGIEVEVDDLTLCCPNESFFITGSFWQQDEIERQRIAADRVIDEYRIQVEEIRKERNDALTKERDENYASYRRDFDGKVIEVQSLREKVADLEQELAKYQIKWQQGEPPAKGFYWSEDKAHISTPIDIAFYDSSQRRTYRWLKLRWAGPIPEPEPEGGK